MEVSGIVHLSYAHQLADEVRKRGLAMSIYYAPELQTEALRYEVRVHEADNMAPIRRVFTNGASLEEACEIAVKKLEATHDTE